jgi:hypothetical protein
MFAGLSWDIEVRMDPMVVPDKSRRKERADESRKSSFFLPPYS